VYQLGTQICRVQQRRQHPHQENREETQVWRQDRQQEQRVDPQAERLGMVVEELLEQRQPLQLTPEVRLQVAQIRPALRRRHPPVLLHTPTEEKLSVHITMSRMVEKQWAQRRRPQITRVAASTL
jgi:hypothetical protein